MITDGSNEVVMKVRLTFTRDLLGTQPTDSKIYETYLINKKEKEMLKSGYTKEQIEEKRKKEPNYIPSAMKDEGFYRGVTVFSRLKIEETGEEIPAMKTHTLKGFFKNACATYRQIEGTLSSEISSYKKSIDNFIDVNDITGENELAPIIVNDEVKEYMRTHEYTLPLLQRPIRISDKAGERVALACSEYVPAGSYVDFEITTQSQEAMNWVIEWLNFGKRNGLACWRNSGKGKFDWIDLELGEKRQIDPKAIKKKKKKKAADDDED